MAVDQVCRVIEGFGQQWTLQLQTAVRGHFHIGQSLKMFHMNVDTVTS
jgi:hypothetical protein